MRLNRPATLCLPIVLALTGCGANLDQPISNQEVEGLSGSTFGGEQPVVGATVTLWAVGTSGYGTGATKIATATAPTSASGNFAFGTITCPYSNTPTYLLSSGGNAGGGTNQHIVLAAASGACGNLASATVNISEVSTAATAYALSHFFTTTVGGAYATDLFGGTAAGSGTYNTGLVNADLYTVPALVDLTAASVQSARTNTTSGTLTTTREVAKLYTIANLLAACVNSSGSTATGTNCGTLFTNTSDGNGTPADTLQAAVQMALFPYKNVSALFALQTATPPFAGGLGSTPHDWSLAISYTSTAFNLSVLSSSTYLTTSNIDIDATGNIWFPTNSATSHGIGRFSPFSATPSFSGPYLTGLIHPQYLAITNQGRIYATDTAYPQVAYTSTAVPNATAAATYTDSSSGYSGNTGPIVAAKSSTGENGDDVLFTTGGNATSLGTSSYRVGYTGDAAGLYSFQLPPVSMVTFAPTTNNELIAAGNNSDSLCDQEFNSTDEGQPASESNGTFGAAPCAVGGSAATNDSPSTGIDVLFSIASQGRLCSFQEKANSGACFTPAVGLSNPEGIAYDGDSNMWVANYANASVSTLGYTASSGTASDYHTTSTLPYIHNGGNGSTFSHPVGIAIDNSGNVWISNACFSYYCTTTAFTLSELIGAAAPTLTPLAAANINDSAGTRPQAITAPVQSVTIPRLGTKLPAFPRLGASSSVKGTASAKPPQ